MKNGFNNQNKNWNKKEQSEPVESNTEVSSEESTEGKYYGHEKDCNCKECK